MKELKISPEEIRRLNDQDRMWFVEYWANYVKTHPDKDWSRQQNILINSVIGSSKNSKLSPKEYLKIKEKL